MKWDDACLRSCRANARWLQLCRQALERGPETAEVSVYALLVTMLAKVEYEDTMDRMDQMLRAGKLPADEKAAVDLCREKYGEAHGLMAGVTDQLFACDFSRDGQEYAGAHAAVGACRDGLRSFQGLPSLVAKVSTDHDLTTVSSLLGALIVGK
ncbi:hypothetical protein BS78_07G039000 [Paspalum vaginatum]|nr:hypothetical protein BS78_07G039000 [Paspalum vaginatum]